MKRGRAEASPLPPSEMSADDAALYDRQIRLWGAASQQKIFESRVLLVGLTGVGAELAKNLALAGVGHITLRDAERVTPGDLSGNFFLGVGSVSANRAAASRAGVQELNKRVEIVVDERDPVQVDSDWLKGFDVCVCCLDDARTAALLNDRCRERSVVFIAVGTESLTGYVFCDASGHLFKLDGVSASSAEPLVMSQGLKFSDLFEAPLPTEGRKCNPSLIQLQNRWKDTAIIHRPGISAVCAIVGGVAGQQVLRVLTHIGRPFENIFVYDGVASIGKVEHVKLEL